MWGFLAIDLSAFFTTATMTGNAWSKYFPIFQWKQIKTKQDNWKLIQLTDEIRFLFHDQFTNQRSELIHSSTSMPQSVSLQQLFFPLCENLLKPELFSMAFHKSKFVFYLLERLRWKFSLSKLLAFGFNLASIERDFFKFFSSKRINLNNNQIN